MSLPAALREPTLTCSMHKGDISHGEGIIPCFVTTLHLEKTPNSTTFKAQQAKGLFLRPQRIP